MEGSYLLAMRRPVYRRHDFYLGFRTERENRVGDAKGKVTSGSPTRPIAPTHRPGADCFVLARKRVNARGAKGAGHPHRSVWSTGNRRSRVVRPKAAAFVGGTSRVSRETHARICERLGVKLPGPTRHVRGVVMIGAHPVA